MSPFSLPQQAPSLPLLLLEGRAFGEFGALLGGYLPLLKLAPRGDGHAVLVLPGLAANDWSTAALRRFLRDRGYRTYGWGQGLNRGPVPGMVEKLRARFERIRKKSGGKVSVIGWSLGGIYARELAKAFPNDVRQVITLCSPFGGNAHTSNVSRTYERLSGRSASRRPSDPDIAKPAPVPSTAIFSRSDGIVAWQSCLEPLGPERENVEVAASHCGIGHHPLALYVIADRLAQGEGRWKPFERGGVLKRLLFRNPLRPL